MINTENSSAANVAIYNLTIMHFGLEQEDGVFNYSHGAGTSSQAN